MALVTKRIVGNRSRKAKVRLYKSLILLEVFNSFTLVRRQRALVLKWHPCIKHFKTRVGCGYSGIISA